MAKKLKIGILIDELIPGGVQITAIQETANLIKLGFNATLLVLMRKGYQTKHHYLVKNIPHKFISDRLPKPLQASFKIPFFRFLTSAHLLSPLFAPLFTPNNEFDLIISHGTTTSMTAQSLWHFRNIPYITVIHDPMIYILENIYAKTPLKILFPIIKPLAHFFEKGFLKNAKACLVDSTVHANYLEQNYQIKPRIIHLAIDSPAKIPKERGSKIITFGRWDAGKNLSLLLKLAQELPTSQIVIAGSWSSQNELSDFKRLIIKKGLSSQVQLITGYQKRSLGKICAQGRFWIHPHFEAFSLSALEAASYGLPIIIPKKSGITELFVDGVHGYFPEKLTVEKIKELSNKLMLDEKLARIMGNNAATMVRKYHTPKTRAIQLISLISKITAKKTQKIVALETGHVGHVGLAGGDHLFEKMVKHLKVNRQINVIIPRNKTIHWKNLEHKVKLWPLTKSALDNSHNPFLILLIYLIRSAKSLMIIRKFPPSTIIYSSTEVLPDVLPAYLSKVTGSHFFWIARVHHLWLPATTRPGNRLVNLASSSLQLLILKLIKNQADLVLVLNPRLKSQVIKMGFQPQKTKILGGGVDFAAISNFKSKTAKIYDAVYLGRIHPTKGIHDLAPIWKKVTSQIPQASLAVIGPGTQSAQADLASEIRKYNLQNSITILGFLPQHKVWSYLKNAKVFLFCDHEAGFGLAVAEAMTAGLPVVGWNIDILGIVYRQGYIKIPIGNNNRFAHTIIKLLTDAKLHHQIAGLAREEAARHDWQITSRKFERILAKISL